MFLSKGGKKVNKRFLFCLVFSHLLFSGFLMAEIKGLSVREQVNQFLGGTVVQVDRIVSFLSPR